MIIIVAGLAALYGGYLSDYYLFKLAFSIVSLAGIITILMVDFEKDDTMTTNIKLFVGMFYSMLIYFGYVGSFKSVFLTGLLAYGFYLTSNSRIGFIFITSIFSFWQLYLGTNIAQSLSVISSLVFVYYITREEKLISADQYVLTQLFYFMVLTASVAPIIMEAM